jgi:hypothetical protein
MRVLVGRVVVGPAGADIRLRVAGLATLVHELEAGAACVAAVLGSAVCSLGYALLPGGDGAPGLGTSRGRR